MLLKESSSMDGKACAVGENEALLISAEAIFVCD